MLVTKLTFTGSFYDFVQFGCWFPLKDSLSAGVPGVYWVLLDELIRQESHTFLSNQLVISKKVLFGNNLINYPFFIMASDLIFGVVLSLLLPIHQTDIALTKPAKTTYKLSKMGDPLL